MKVIKRVFYKGVVINRLANETYDWGLGKGTLKECKNQIDKEFKGQSPFGNMFTI